MKSTFDVVQQKDRALDKTSLEILETGSCFGYPANAFDSRLRGD